MGIKKRAHPIEETDVPHVGMVRVGRTLEHPVFGLGEVVDIARWESGDITICLDFPKHGSKWLVPEFARLAEPQPPAKKRGLLSKLFDRNKGNT